MTCGLGSDDRLAVAAPPAGPVAGSGKGDGKRKRKRKGKGTRIRRRKRRGKRALYAQKMSKTIGF